MNYSRRSFLKAASAAAFMLCGIKPAAASIAGPFTLPVGKLSLHNTNTGESISVTYRDAGGRYSQEALAILNWHLRCHHTNKITDMDLRVIEYLNMVDKSLRGNHVIHVISAFRSPEYNDILAQRERNAAKNSLHREGKAVDITVPGVNLESVWQSAARLRYGGLGYYSKSGFIHLDSGRFRVW